MLARSAERTMRKRFKSRRFRIGLITVVGLACAVVITVAEGEPAGPHPEYTFDSALVAQILRGMVVFAVWIAVWTVPLRAFGRGELPNVTSGGFEYSGSIDNDLEEIRKKVEAVAAKSAEQSDNLNLRLDRIEAFISNAVEPLIKEILEVQRRGDGR